MKVKSIKYLFIFSLFIIIPFILGACTLEENANINTNDNYSKIDKNAQLEVLPPKNPINNSTNINKDMRTLDNQKDLAKEYSQAVINTSLGEITVKFYSEESPVTVNNFMNLAQDGFYDGTKFHRVIKDFMIQAGDPNSKEDDTSMYGTGSPGYKFADEFNNHKLVAGSLAMANSGSNTNGSQFFIVTAESTPWLDGMHTNFGYVVDGMDVVKEVEAVQTGARDIPVEPVVINSIKLIK